MTTTNHGDERRRKLLREAYELVSGEFPNIMNNIVAFAGTLDLSGDRDPLAIRAAIEQFCVGLVKQVKQVVLLPEGRGND